MFYKVLNLWAYYKLFQLRHNKGAWYFPRRVAVILDLLYFFFLGSQTTPTGIESHIRFPIFFFLGSQTTPCGIEVEEANWLLYSFHLPPFATIPTVPLNFVVYVLIKLQLLPLLFSFAWYMLTFSHPTSWYFENLFLFILSFCGVPSPRHQNIPFLDWYLGIDAMLGIKSSIVQIIEEKRIKWLRMVWMLC